MKKIKCDLQELQKQINSVSNLHSSSQLKSKLEDIKNVIDYSSGETAQALTKINTELSNMEKNMMLLFETTEAWLRDTYDSFLNNDNDLAKRMKKESTK